MEETTKQRWEDGTRKQGQKKQPNLEEPREVVIKLVEEEEALNKEGIPKGKAGST